MSRSLKFYSKLFFWLIFPLIFVSCGISKSVNHQPDISQYDSEVPNIQQRNDSLLVYGNNFLTKNKQQLWELYTEGNPLQMGYNKGALTQNLIQRQEKVFFDKVETFVPSKFKQELLIFFLKWYNRKMNFNVRNDFQAEIYGLSNYLPDRYDYIAPKFLRSMYLHGAHDIGHALQDLMLVGCTSMAVWDENSEDGTLLLGRNFDFYVGDEFAKEKIVSFVKPEVGIPYMSVTWAGFTGVVSGMNNKGISVTINAAKSKIPLTAKTPISLVTKEILQYASNIDEAVEIARKRKVFVSESIMVGSAPDRKAVLIEVSPEKVGVFDVPNSTALFCSNHFQSDTFEKDQRNVKQIQKSHSQYRFEKLQEILKKETKLNPEKIAETLRETKGLNNENIGFGNEKSINQLLAHHAVIFSPEKKLVWVSSNPYQLGEMVCFDLNKIFAENPEPGNLGSNELNISRDPFADSAEFKNYQKFRRMNREILSALDKKSTVSESFISEYISSNPDFWTVYFKTGKYYFGQKNYEKAAEMFRKALEKEITTVPDRDDVLKYLKKTERKL